MFLAPLSLIFFFPYALTGDAEFFAVVSEYFFQQPELMKGEHPEIFKMLGGFYKQGRVNNVDLL
ncbi:zinc-dependent peptidase [Flavihumibacter sp. R14]|nr:zinc-dependent peptidase [Flavihumibacter soli]